MIEAALAAGARTIIARDADLTVLKQPFGIQILTPRRWLATLPRADRRTLASACFKASQPSRTRRQGERPLQTGDAGTQRLLRQLPLQHGPKQFRFGLALGRRPGPQALALTRVHAHGEHRRHGGSVCRTSYGRKRDP